MTISNDPHLSGLLRALASFIKCIRRQKPTLRVAKSNTASPRAKHRSHRTTAFFEMP